MGLYDPPFATLTWLYGRDARSSITGITLIAGFASTIGWPLTAALLDIFFACRFVYASQILAAARDIPLDRRVAPVPSSVTLFFAASLTP